MSPLVFVLFLVLSAVSGVHIRNEEFDLDLETNQIQQNNGSPALLRGRLQLFSPEPDHLSCLSRVPTHSQSFFYVTKCTYDLDQFFVFDSSKGELRSADKMDAVWTYDSDASDAVIRTIGGKAESRSFFTVQKPNMKWKWNVSIADFEPMVLFNRQGNTLCVEVSDISGHEYAFVHVVTQGATDQCAQIKFMLPEDDYVAGSIRHADTAQQATSQPDCVTYDSTAVPPRSALYLATCDPARTDQRFMYNMVTHHLRWATATPGTLDGPVLFFWWSGPIKSYFDFDEQNQHYGWKISLLNSASVISLDDRGYTGYCWTVVQDGGRRSITANQTCGSFALIPERENFFVKRLQTPPRATTTMIFRVSQAGSGPAQCLRAHRKANLVAAGDGSVSIDRVWRIVVGDCNFESYWLPQRFVLTQKVGSPCSNSYCPGLIRWVGDYEHVLFVATLPDSRHFSGNFPIISSGLDEASIPYEFDFPLNHEGPIRTKLPDGTPACFGQKPSDNFVSVTTNMSLCLTIHATLATQMGPDYDDPAILTLARFDFTSVVILPKTTAGLKIVGDRLHNLRKQARTDPKARDKFFRNFDYYFADLGVSGRRRFARAGAGLQITPFGDLAANLRPSSRNGVQFAFLQSSDKLLQNRYTLVSVTLSVTTLDPQKTYLLMSFARGSGCVVFLTGLGRLGMKCLNDGKDMFTLQVQDWADPSFTLTKAYHKITLLFSTHAGDPVRLYVDGVLALSTTNSISWNILNSALYIRVFTDFYLWQYHPLPASLTRFSLVVSNDLSKLDTMARRNVLSNKLEFGKFHGNPNAIVTASGLQTKWSNCQVVTNSTTGFVEGFTCTLSATKHGALVTVPRDVFNLACSRPRCSIAFHPSSPVVGSSFRFTYLSNYPADFKSENVGSPGLFRDPSFVSDGWTTQSVSFGINYAPDAASLLEVDESEELEVSDVMRYRCKQNCCVSIGHQNIDNSQGGDVF